MDAFTTKLVLHTNELEEQNRSLNLRVNELEQEARGNEARVRALDQAKADLDKAQTKVEAAEKARAAAERAREKEHHARLGAEEEADDLKTRIVQLQEQPSRLAKLRDEIGV